MVYNRIRFDEQIIKRALNEYISSTKSGREICESYNIPESTFWYYHRKNKNGNKVANKETSQKGGSIKKIFEEKNSRDIDIDENKGVINIPINPKSSMLEENFINIADIAVKMQNKDKDIVEKGFSKSRGRCDKKKSSACDVTSLKKIDLRELAMQNGCGDLFK